jgi:hypothetical protein
VNEQVPFPSSDQPRLSGGSFVDRNQINPIAFVLFCLAGIFLIYFMGSVVVMLLVGANITRESVWQHRLLTMLGHLFFFFGPSLICARLIATNLKELFPWRVPSFREAFFGLLGLFWLQQVFQIVLHFQEQIPLPEELKRVIDPIRESVEATLREMVRAESLPELGFVILVVAIVPAIVEELLFRGFVQGSFQRRFTPLSAILFSGVIFAFFHLNPFSLVPLIGLGLYFGFLRYRSDSIIIAMTAHFLNNVLAVLAVYFGLGEEVTIGTASGIEPNTAALVAQLVLLSMLFAVTLSAYIRVTARDDSDSTTESS